MPKPARMLAMLALIILATPLEHAATGDSSPFADVARWNGATWFEPVLHV